LGAGVWWVVLVRALALLLSPLAVPLSLPLASLHYFPPCSPLSFHSLWATCPSFVLDCEQFSLLAFALPVQFVEFSWGVSELGEGKLSIGRLWRVCRLSGGGGWFCWC